jgi:hypothetical protein
VDCHQAVPSEQAARRVMVQFEELFAFGDSFADASPVVRPSEIADHAAMAMQSPADVS